MTNPFQDAVELLLIMKKRKWEGKNFQCHGQDLKAIIAALSACRGLADGSEVIVPIEPTEAMVAEGRLTLPGPVDICDSDIEDIYVTMIGAATSRPDTGWKAEYRKVVLEEAASALHNIDQFDGCEKLGFMDWETGVRECAIDVKGENCLCAERDEAITKAVEKIRALAASPQQEKLK
jgi:hypothetical protein